MYEDPKILAEYLLFHYAKAEEILPFEFGPKAALGFAERTPAAADAFLSSCAATEGMQAEATPRRALDMGCAVGRSSFELARRFERVLGVDFSHAFIDAAQKLAAAEALPYLRKDEGNLSTELIAQAPVEEALRQRVSFAQGDACHLPEELGGEKLEAFDLVHAANLICRLPEPSLFLQRLPSLVKPGGLLILVTPCTWLEEFTPMEHWIGGKLVDGVRQSTLDGLKLALSADFELLKVEDCPFLIREHQRKYQWSVSQLSVWSRAEA